MLLIQIASITGLLLIFFQDVKERSVYWVAFPCLTVLFFSLRLLQLHAVMEIFRTTVFNLLFIAIQILMISLYFSIKNRAWINITDNHLGWGDVLFLLSIACYLSILNFIVFYILSLTSVLVIWLMWRAIIKTKNGQIPLAGLQALIFVSCLAISWWLIPVNLTTDDWLLNLMGK